MERYEKILTDHRLPDMFSEYLTLGQDGGLVIYGCKLGEDRAFVIRMSEVMAFHVHEEFCHPDMSNPEEPVKRPFYNESKATCYPALEVINSKWIDSILMEHQQDGANHFQFLSYSDVIDVISYKRPPVSYTHLTLPTICSV